MMASRPYGLEVSLRKVALACEQQGKDIHATFQAFDASGDGYLSVQEFEHALAQLDIGLTSEEVSSILASLEANADGMVSYNVFLLQLPRGHNPMP